MSTLLFDLFISLFLFGCTFVQSFFIILNVVATLRICKCKVNECEFVETSSNLVENDYVYFRKTLAKICNLSLISPAID